MMTTARPIAELIIDDLGGAFTVALGYIGDKLGLFAALAAATRSSSHDVAERANLDERYVREWLNAMVAARYIERDRDDDSYFLTPDQKAALVDEGARTFAAGAFQLALPSILMTPRLIEVFRRGGGISFDELSTEIPSAIDRMHRPWFDHLLVQEWLPGVPRLVEALERGISVLDVGCGMGRSTLAMARAYPNSVFLGIDPHAASIDRARALVRTSGLPNVTFSALSIETLADGDKAFDLVVAIDCVHDMAHPVEGLRAMRSVLTPDGAVFWSEPSGSHEPLDNRNPHGRLRASLSPFHCLTVSLAAGGAGLGTIIGEAGARKLAAAAGFTTFQPVPIESSTQQFFLLDAMKKPI
jgi:2-polyprenyl-3-methyl-5-hydroxy-6-metoxy-1,4-benzoquinol methylase